MSTVKAPSADEITGAGRAPTPPTTTTITPSNDDTDTKTSTEGQSDAKAPVFTRNNVPHVIVINIGLQKLLPDMRFTFRLRLALSKEIQDAQEQLAGQPAAAIAAAQKGQILDEVCDLLTDVPEGFGDWPADNRNPADQLRDYIKGATDPDARYILDALIRGVNNAYWGAVTPREFPAKI